MILWRSPAPIVRLLWWCQSRHPMSLTCPMVTNKQRCKPSAVLWSLGPTIRKRFMAHCMSLVLLSFWGALRVWFVEPNGARAIGFGLPRRLAPNMTFSHVVTWSSGKIVPFKIALTRLKHSLLKRLSSLTSLQILSANVLPKPKPKVTWPLMKPWSFPINEWCASFGLLCFSSAKEARAALAKSWCISCLICILPACLMACF